MTMVCALCYITRKQKITVWNVEIRVVCHLSFWFSELLMHRLISLSETLSMININIHHCNRRTWQNINKWRLGSFQIWVLFVCQFTHFHLAQYLLMKHYKLFFSILPQLLKSLPDENNLLQFLLPSVVRQVIRYWGQLLLHTGAGRFGKYFSLMKSTFKNCIL